MEEIKKALISKNPLVLLALEKINVTETIMKDSRKDDIEKMKGDD